MKKLKATHLKNKLMKNLFTCLVLIIGLALPFAGKSQAFTENFDDITTLAGNGWVLQNNSTPVGSTSWFQGNPTVFSAYTGATNSYIGANFNNTTGNNTISNWLLTPNRTFRNGDVITFYTRCSPDNMYPDRLQVRLSTNGASTNVGTGATAVGDFTTLLLEVNPTLTTNVYPYANWGLYTITISGLPAPTSGRIAFRYFVTSAGPLGTNSDYIGIDNVVYTPYVCPAFTMTPGGALTGGTAGSAYSTSLTQTGALGTPSYAITSGALPPGMTLSASGTISGTPTASGTFNFTATVSDASGCSGSQNYSITVDCPANPISIGSTPALCENGAIYTLIEGSPAGGAYSGIGVSGGQFDPTSGTQTITYDLIDPYGCPHTSNYTITVNTPPTVGAGVDLNLCEGDSVVLSGSGATSYSWDNGVTNGVGFTVSTGTTTYTVTGTDANNCSNTDEIVIIVNALPSVDAGADVVICEGELVTLNGSGAVSYTWNNGVADAVPFSPIITTTYTVTGTDANNCIGTDDVVVTVNDPNASMSGLGIVCVDDASITLTQGSPAGGSYTGTGVSGGSFDPATAGLGTHTITYTVEVDGCEGSAQGSIEVDGCLGIDNQNTQALSVYPNPTSSELTIIFENSGDAKDIVLISTDGKIVFETIAQANTVFNKKINVSDFNRGIYFIKVAGNAVQKVVLN